MKQIFKGIKIIAILILALAYVGCDEEDAALPQVDAGFTYTLNGETGTVTFINTSSNADTYTWDFGDETGSTEINPIKTYPSGTYTIVLVAKNGAGAMDSFEDIITLTLPEPLALPITFDNELVNYEVTELEGATFQILENPDASGSNTSTSNVAEVVNAGAVSEGIMFDLEIPVDLTVDKSIQMNFWSSTAIEVLVKLDQGAGTGAIQATTSHGGTGWEIITLDFSSSDEFSRLSLYADASGTSEGTFYIDDIEQVNSGPAITLNGSATINVALGGTFTDPGATAVDGFGVDISNSIVIGGDTVDVNTLGTYVITYNVSDDDGNEADEVTRTVIVEEDTTPPVITLNGDSVVNVTVGGAFTDPGATAADNVDGDISSSIVVAGDTVDTNTIGTYIITYNVSDAAGNAAAEVTRTVNVAAGGGGGGAGTGNFGLVTNGGFETGDTSGWTSFATAAGASFTASSAESACGSFSGNLISDFDAGNGGAVDAVVKQANIGIGTVTPNTQVTISFDARGSVGDGGVFFAEFFSEVAGGGVSSAQILSNGPLALTDTWTHYSFTTTTGPDVSAGITLQMKTSCGPVAGCVVNAFFDNVFVDLGTTGGDDCSGGSGNGGGTGGGGTGGGTGGTGAELTTNGDFETGDLSGWTTFVDAAGASFVASSTNPSGGSFSGNLISDFAAGNGGAVDAVVKQANLGAGTVLPNTEYFVSFDLRGAAGDGGVFFVEFFSELSGGGVSSAQIITNGPHPLTDSWTTYSYVVTTGSDVSGGITLQLKTSCGPVPGCLVDVFFDNVSLKLN